MSDFIAPSPALLDFARSKIALRLYAAHGDKSEPIIRNMLAEKMSKVSALSSDMVGTMLLTELPAHEFILC